MKEKVGINEEHFELIFQNNLYDAYKEMHEQRLRILSVPKQIYNQWYYKILNFITFGKYFNSGWTYYVEQV